MVVCAFAMIMEGPAPEFVVLGIVVIRVFPKKIG
jgi:hypothetical protein